MIIGDHKRHSKQTPPFQLQKEVLPARLAFSVGQLHCKDLTPAFFIDPDGDLYRLAADHPIFSDLHVAGVHNKEGIAFLKWPLGKPLQTFIQALIDRANG